MQSTLNLQGNDVEYTLLRSHRRTLTMNITAKGLEVRAPIQIADTEIRHLLQRKADWILRKLKETNFASPFTWRDGENLWLLGNPLTLQLVNEKGIRCTEGVLYAPVVTSLSSINGLDMLLAWYRRQAWSDFSKRVALFAPRLGFVKPPVRLTNAKTLWGSCNSKGEVRLNWRLIQAPPTLINYVVCHELAHLKEMNHSAAFWQVVEGLYPDYKVAKQTLKMWTPKLKRL